MLLETLGGSMRNSNTPGMNREATRASAADAGHAGGALLVAVLGSLLPLAGCGNPPGSDAAHKINGSVHVEAGKALGTAETVNGAIDVDANATITKATTVNGSIHIGAHATATTVKTVNGSITIDDGAKVAGMVETVNGALTLHNGAEVAGALRNVSGRIELDGAHVVGGIRTAAGDISVLGASRVEGGIVVEKAGNGLIRIGNEAPRIVIGPGATVQGELRFGREVRLYVSDKATVGAVSGATPVSFAGDSPPG
jgi:cytoskeletal protein CcmA (bactofilin family)